MKRLNVSLCVAVFELAKQRARKYSVKVFFERVFSLLPKVRNFYGVASARYWLPT